MKPIDPKKTKEELVSFLKISFQKAGFDKAVIAVSGGIDSSTSLALAAEALGKKHVFPIVLPYGTLNNQGTNDARLVVRGLGIAESQILEVNIQPLVDPMIALDPGMDHGRKGNIMARARMIVLFDQAKNHTALVVGTENKSEYLLGYFTRFGDEASDIEPLGNLYKTQVYELARFLGIPEQILTKKPTAGLWEGQTDEGEFGFRYTDADEILSLYHDAHNTVEDIVASGLKQSIVESVIKRVIQNEFKHRVPILPR